MHWILILFFIVYAANFIAFIEFFFFIVSVTLMHITHHISTDTRRDALSMFGYNKMARQTYFIEYIDWLSIEIIWQVFISTILQSLVWHYKKTNSGRVRTHLDQQIEINKLRKSRFNFFSSQIKLQEQKLLWCWWIDFFLSSSRTSVIQFSVHLIWIQI